MDFQKFRNSALTRLYRYTILAVVVWTLFVFGSMHLTGQSIDQQTNELAKNAARVHFQKDLAFRLWATTHGGVYVPADDRTPPNPYLSHIPERDIETPSGKKLTLMNPAYIIRQMMDEYPGLYGIKGHVTSQKPLNPINAPDEWETSALHSFEKGVEDVFDFVQTADGQGQLRLMQPMVTKEECLKCHAHQGYQVGDIRGGVSVTVPMGRYNTLHDSRIRSTRIFHGLVWMLGLVATGFIAFHNKGLILEKYRSEKALRERESLYRSMFEKNSAVKLIIEPASGNIIDANSAACAYYGYSLEELISMRIMDINQMSSEEVRAEMEKAKDEQKQFFEFRHRLASGDVRDVHVYSGPVNVHGQDLLHSIIQDVTEQKKMEEALVTSKKSLEAMINAFPEPAFLLNREHVILAANVALGRRFNTTHDQVIGLPIDILLPPEMAKNRLAKVEECIQTNQPVSFEDVRDGAVFKHHIYPIFDDQGEVTGVAVLALDLTLQRQAEQAIESSLQEKETLLRELYHRTKNNMHAITNMMETQATYTDDERLTAAFMDTKNRIRSMGLVHQKLYQSQDLTHIDLHDYLSELIYELIIGFGITSRKVKLTMDIEPIRVVMNTAMPCGQIVNELITNIVKYAFPGDRTGAVNISLKKEENDTVQLCIQDDGVGVDPDFDFRKSETMGIQTVISLAEHKLKGTLSLDVTNGMRWCLCFPDTPK